MKNLAPDIQCQALSEYANRRSKDTLNNPPAYFMSLLQVHSLSLIMLPLAVHQESCMCSTHGSYTLPRQTFHLSTLGWWNQLLYACLGEQLGLWLQCSSRLLVLGELDKTLPLGVLSAICCQHCSTSIHIGTSADAVSAQLCALCAAEP